MARKCFINLHKYIRMCTLLCSLYTGNKQQLSLLRRKDPESYHTNWKDISRLELICCGWKLRVIFCLNKTINLLFSNPNLQENKMCTAVVNWILKHWFMLDVGNCYMSE